MSRWFEDYATINELATWLHEHGHFTEIRDVLYFFEKPWKYEPEYLKMRKENSHDGNS